MLKLEHIMRLSLDRERLLAHNQMPPPAYSVKELTSQIAAIGDATISGLLDIEPDQFKDQLAAAREFGVSWVTSDQDQKLIGVSAATSVIGDGDIMLKNVIVPRDTMQKNPRLKAHYVIGVFIRGKVVKGQAPDVSEVEIAGWTDTWGIKQNKRPYSQLPPTFKSKLPVVMVPCAALRPINTLVTQLQADNMCV
jgi:hypothetical protein